MTLFPDDGFKITCTSADKQGRFTQFYSVEITPKTWEQELAHARTFCFYEEIEYPHQERPDQGRQPGERRGHSRRRGADDRAAALSGGICPAQDARHRRRPVAAGPAAARASDRGEAEPRGELRTGAAHRRADAQAAARRADLRPAAGHAESWRRNWHAGGRNRRAERRAHGHRGGDEDCCRIAIRF